MKPIRVQERLERERLNPSRMEEPQRTLLLDAMKALGQRPAKELLSYIEENLTQDQYKCLYNFLLWLAQHGISIGHGTVDLRWFEFHNEMVPLERQAAYEWAMKRMGG